MPGCVFEEYGRVNEPERNDNCEGVSYTNSCASDRSGKRWKDGFSLSPLQITTNYIIPYYTIELACNITSYCTSGCDIFTSHRRVKMQPTSVIKCSLSIPEQHLVSSHRVTHRSNVSIPIKAHRGC